MASSSASGSSGRIATEKKGEERSDHDQTKKSRLHCEGEERRGGKTPSQFQSGGTSYKAPETWIADEMGLTRRCNAVPRVAVFLADSSPAAAALVRAF